MTELVKRMIPVKGMDIDLTEVIQIDHDTTLTDLVEHLQQIGLRALVDHPRATLIKLDDRDLLGRRIGARVCRMETDSEFEARKVQHEKNQEAEKQKASKKKEHNRLQEIERYKELRAKYGDTV